MIRLFGVFFFIVVIGAALFHINPWIVGVPLAVLLLGAYTFGGFKTICPECGSRIKIGYPRCRTCGWSAKPQEGE
jgi:hypothetical protein